METQGAGRVACASPSGNVIAYYPLTGMNFDMDVSFSQQTLSNFNRL